jgi:hypothetical protein
MSVHADAASVIRSAEQVLSFARQGAKDFFARGERSESGLYNAITQGRSVTFVLQNLRSHHPNFDRWYEVKQEELRGNPAARWFLELRNRLEKQGSMGNLYSSIRIGRLDSQMMAEAARNPPPGVVGTFFGDKYGRSGWNVLLADGTTTQVYFKSPATFESSLAVEGGPPGFSFDMELQPWLDGLERLVAEARSRFTSDSGDVR